jgi:hypothetical protein
VGGHPHGGVQKTLKLVYKKHPKGELMKNGTMTIIARNCCGALLALFFATQASAGPGQQETYVPVKTMKDADRIAFACGKCKSVRTMTADADRGNLRSFTCDRCKTKFVQRDTAHGGTQGQFVLQNDAGDTCSLLSSR